MSLALSLALAMSATTGLAADKSQSQTEELQQTTAHHLGWADPDIAAMVETSSQALVDVLERADQELAVQEPVLAANNLAYAENIAKSITLQMPYVEMKDRLENAKGKLEAGATHDFIEELAPVYASIDDLLLVAPEMSKRVKEKVHQAQSAAKAGKQDEALKQVNAVIDNIVATRVFLPIVYVNSQIDTARKALFRADIVGARKSVAKALESLVVIVKDNYSAVDV
jgi:hypothetical protein